MARRVETLWARPLILATSDTDGLPGHASGVLQLRPAAAHPDPSLPPHLEVAQQLQGGNPLQPRTVILLLVLLSRVSLKWLSISRSPKMMLVFRFTWSTSGSQAFSLHLPVTATSTLHTDTIDYVLGADIYNTGEHGTEYDNNPYIRWTLTVSQTPSSAGSPFCQSASSECSDPNTVTSTKLWFPCSLITRFTPVCCSMWLYEKEMMCVSVFLHY